MPKITIRSTRRLRQQQIIASLLANGRTVSPRQTMSPRLERRLREKISSNSIGSLRALRLREVSFEDSLSSSTSSSSEATLDSVTPRDRDNSRDRVSSSSSASLSMHSRKRTRCSLSSLSPSVCLSSLADDASSSETLGLAGTSRPSSPKHRPTTPILKHRISSGSGGGWGHFVDVVPPDNDHEDSVSPLPGFWSPFDNNKSQLQQSSHSLSSSPFAYAPYTLKRHHATAARHLQQQVPPRLTATISSDGSESPGIQEHGAVEKALSVMSIS